jgi:hypothetical protein
MSARELVIALVDSSVLLVAVLLVFWCAVNIVSSLRHGYLYFSGKRAARAEEPVAFWVGIVAWFVVSAILIFLLLRSF